MASIDLGGVGALISALTGLLVAGGSVLLQRQRNSVLDVGEMEVDLEVRTAQYQAALRHIRLLEDDRASQGLDEIVRPAELGAGYFERKRGGRRRGHGKPDQMAPEVSGNAP